MRCAISRFPFEKVSPSTKKRLYLRGEAETVKIGAWQAGGMPIEFNHLAPCNGIADGTVGMHWILPSRDIIAASIEMRVHFQRVDGIVALSPCDEIFPAPLMALARMNLPSVGGSGGEIYTRIVRPVVKRAALRAR